MSAVCSISRGSTPKQNFSKNPAKTKFSDAAIKYLATPKGLKYMVLYPTDLSIRWAKWINPNLPKQWDAVQTQAKVTQKILKVAYFPAGCQKFIERCKNVNAAIKEKRPAPEIAAATVKAGLGAALLAQPVSSFLYLADKSRVLPLSSKGLSILKGATGIGIIGFAGESLYNIVSDAKSLCENKASSPLFTVAKIVRNLSLLGIGISALLVLFSSVHIATILFLCFSTVNLIFTLGIYFVDQMFQPTLEGG